MNIINNKYNKYKILLKNIYKIYNIKTIALFNNF